MDNVDKLKELQSEAIEAATEHIRDQRRKQANARLIIVCLSALLALAIIGGTVFGCFAICKQHETLLEQQYAINMQYAALMEYISGAETETTTTHEADASDGGTAVIGDGNTVVGGDVNGES